MRGWRPSVAALQPHDLHAMRFSRLKTAYVVETSRLVASGDLDLAALRTLSATRAERTDAAGGPGPWSQHYLMMRSLGLADCVPVGDTGLTAGLRALFHLEERPDADATQRLVAAFSPHRSLATAHLWPVQPAFSMTFYCSYFATSVGPFGLAVDVTGTLAATAFGAERALLARLAGGTLLDDQVRTRNAREQVLEYFAGQRRRFDLPLSLVGTAFQRKVWNALREVPFGQTRAYGQIAAAIGAPAAARAVGRANATNPLCLIVPCHRVIGADGALTGFAFGSALKRRLLDHERAWTADPAELRPTGRSQGAATVAAAGAA